MMFVILISSLFLYLVSAQSTPQVPTLADLKELKQDLINAYDTITLGESITFKPFAGTVLRLIFHDCGGPPQFNTPGIVSKCDGCIAMNDLADHANLEFRAINPLDDIYLGPKQFNHKMTRSDFWAFAATVAILHTRNQAFDGDQMPEIPYFFGREDCSTSPDVDISTTQIKQFPAGTFVYSQTKDWMETNLGFNDEQIVAILGAHTIGRMHPGDSGFTGPWVSPWGTFDNRYYRDIVNVAWVQKTARSNGLKEWGSSQFSFFGMLNADISLLKDLSITNNADGTVSCGSGINTCSDNAITADIVRSFANDNQLWLNKFVPAYIKMSTVGYDVDTDLVTVFDDEVESGIPRSDTGVSDFRPVIWFESGVDTSPRKCLDIDVLNIDNNPTVQMWECNQDIQQRFYFEPVANTNFVVIKSAFSGDDNCLDAHVLEHASNANGAGVQMWDCNFEVQQQWTVDPVTNTIRSSNGKCLDAAIETQHNNGGRIQLWDCGWDSNGQPVPQQTWIMKAPGTEIISSKGKCIDVDVFQHNTNGATVQVWDCNDAVQQTFYFMPVPHTNFVVIENSNCLDVHDEHHTSAQNPGRVQMWDCNSGDQQQWILEGNTIKSSNGKCLEEEFFDWDQDINGGTIQIWDCNGEEQQTWSIHLKESSNYHAIPNENDKYYIRISEPRSIIIYGILIVLLICNIMACYININGKNKFNKTKYNKIKYIESDSDTEFVSS